MLFRQVLHPDLGCASYVIADTAAGLGAVVDPKRDVGEYLELAAANGFTIAHVIETHNHADHVSGRGRLAEATGARSWVSPLAGAGYPHDPFADGAEIELGQVRLRALHVPGHRPEHTAVVVVDGSRSSLPCAVLTGDSLFVNDVARPDLAVEKREGAAQLYHAIGRLLELDDGVEVFPGHTGGSLCGSARMSETTSSTIGFERASNPMLRLGEESLFVSELIHDLPPQPPNFTTIAEANRAGTIGAAAEVARFAPERLAAAIAAGALAIDGRPAGQYDAAHIPGTIGIDATVNGFGTKAAWIAEPGAELVLVAADEPAALHMQGLLESVGLSAAGMLAGGFAGLDRGRTRRRAVPGDGRGRPVRGRRPGADPRRARPARMGRAAHHRISARRLPRHRTGDTSARSRPAGGRDLLDRASQRDGGGTGAPLRLRRGDPRQRRRRRHLGGAGVPDRAVAAGRGMSAPELSATEVAAALERGELAAVDVREPGEWDAGHIAGALWIPMGEFADRVSELPEGRLAIVCRSGARSGVVADWLERSGVDAVNLAGGMEAWHAASLPIEPVDGWIA